MNEDDTVNLMLKNIAHKENTIIELQNQISKLEEKNVNIQNAQLSKYTCVQNSLEKIFDLDINLVEIDEDFDIEKILDICHKKSNTSIQENLMVILSWIKQTQPNSKLIAKIVKEIEKENDKDAKIPNLILVRGIPGSGKNTYAQKKYPGYKIISTDDYFMCDGIYKFDMKKIYDAHDWCINEVKKVLNKKQDVVVCNTFIKKYHMKIYIDKLNDIADIKIIRITSRYKNIHQVPLRKVEKMNIEIEPINGEIFDELELEPNINHQKDEILENGEQMLNEYETKNWTSLDEIRKITQDKIFIKRNESYENNLKNLMCCVYFWMLPLRYQWANIKIINNEKNNYKQKNYILIRDGEIEIILNEEHEMIRFNIEIKELTGIQVYAKLFNVDYVKQQILESIEKYPRKYLFSELGNKLRPMNKKIFSNCLELIIEPYAGRKMTVQLVRKIYVTYLFEKKPFGHFNIISKNSISKNMDICDFLVLECYIMFYKNNGSNLMARVNNTKKIFNDEELADIAKCSKDDVINGIVNEPILKPKLFGIKNVNVRR